MPDDSEELGKLVERGNNLVNDAWNCLTEQVVLLHDAKQKCDDLRKVLTKYTDDAKKMKPLKLLEELIKEIDSILSDIKKEKYVPKDTRK